MKLSETEHGKLAVKFANALVNGDYILAESLVDLREEVNLELEFNEMVEYGEGPVTYIAVMNEMVSWPSRQDDDIGWAYVALSGEGFSEAVSVVVSKHDGSTKITHIEWGRP